MSAEDAAGLLPADQPIHEVVDHYVDLQLQAAGVGPAEQADEANIIRRTMLDLVGRIPTAAEAKLYLAAESPTKREAAVDRLVTSPGFTRHQANELSTLLMGKPDDKMLKYLKVAVAENRPWDQIFREMLAGKEENTREFLKSRVKDLDRLANDASVVFFGVNVSCAQCHDHPLVSEWTQAHFFGMKSFFSRTFENGDHLGEREYGLVNYKTTEGEEKTAQLMFLTGTVLEEPAERKLTDDEKKKEKELLEQLKKDKKAPPTPAYSRRAQLAEVALRDEERGYFARSIVNRVWDRLFGRGLVAPVDQMHPENPASHPKLLEWLARDLIEHGYDLRRLVRGLVLSKTYSRSSRWHSDEHPSPDLFAVANVRPLTPLQYAASLRLASMSPTWFPEDIASEEFAKRIEQVENSARGFANLIEQPAEDFQVSVTEALLFNNSSRINTEFLRDASDTLVGQLKTIEDTKALVEAAVWNVLTRPVANEADTLSSYLEQYSENRVIASQQLVWALLTTNEARFNY
ncbi:MAG: hypothetical protein CMJ64_27575 [Planctomycetaceae bacterium]|nr:hypothetical protein [Planctomycetaceae bacterium]